MTLLSRGEGEERLESKRKTGRETETEREREREGGSVKKEERNERDTEDRDCARITGEDIGAGRKTSR